MQLNGRIPKKSDVSFLSPERASTYQPRATPWVMVEKGFLRPERALHKRQVK